MNYFNDDLKSIHQKLVNKEITAEELTRETLSNISQQEEEVNAFISISEKAIEQAKKIDQDGIDANNLLSGIPLAIKDNIVGTDLKTTAASKMLENFQSIYDATVIEKLKNLDSVVVGKTNMDEFAMGGSTETSYFKKTHNPWNLNRVPGGSSGGSASAVAAGEVLAALGSDTGGSIRQPAAFNGIVGMKPTYGRVSRFGLIAFASSFDQIGPLTRSVYDNAVMLNVISGLDDKDATSSAKEVPDYTENIDQGVQGLKIGIPKEFMAEGVSKDIKDSVMKAADKYRELGATVEEVSLPNSKYGVTAYYILASSEASSNLERFDGIRYGYRTENANNLEDIYVKSRSEGFGSEIKRRIMFGTYSLSAGYFDAYFNQAAKIRTMIINDFKAVFKDYDLIIAPTTPTTAFRIDEEISDPVTMYMNDTLTIPVNMAGLPGMSIPVGFDENNLPIGMQLIGKPFDESTIYRAGFAFEKNTDYHTKTPKLGGH